MSYQKIENSIKGASDIETNQQRVSEVKYELLLPDGEIEGLFVYLDTHAAKRDTNNSAKLREIACKKHRWASVSVDYYMCNTRRSNPDCKSFSSVINIDSLMKVYNDINCKEGASNLRTGALSIDNKIAELKEEGSIDKDLQVILCDEIAMKNKEVSTFGLIESMDVLHVIDDVFKKYPQIPKNNTVIMGNNHGGYMATLIAKLSPNTLSLVVDNSSYSDDFLHKIAGSEYDKKFYEEKYRCTKEDKKTEQEHVLVHAHIHTFWTFYYKDIPGDNGVEKYKFLAHHYAIRNPKSKSHIMQMSEQSKGKTKYIFVQNSDEKWGKLEQKEKMLNMLKEAGYAASLHVMNEDSENWKLDEKTGLRMNEEVALEKYLKIAKENKREQNDWELGSKISYKFRDQMQYVFDYSSGRLEGELIRLDN